MKLHQLQNLSHSSADLSINDLWQQMIECNLQNTKLWQKYLHFQLTHQNNNNDDDSITVIFADAMRSLQRAKTKAFSSIKFHDGPNCDNLKLHIGSIEQTMMNVFVLYLKYLWFCGFRYSRKKALALVQAIIEFNVFAPKANEKILDEYRRNLIYFQLFSLE